MGIAGEMRHEGRANDVLKLKKKSIHEFLATRPI